MRAWPRFAAAALSLLSACSAALAFWSADGRHYVVSTNGDVAVLDANSGRIVRAFPLDVDVSKPMPSRVQPPSLLASPYRTREQAFLSRDGRRLAVTSSQALHVWNVETGRLELRVPGARHVAVLGERGEHVAFLRRLEDHAHAFVIWEMATGKPVFERAFATQGQGIFAYPLGSHRFAAVAMGQRELWMWNHQNRSLDRVALPRDFFIQSVLLGADDSRLAVAGGPERPGPDGLARGRQIAVFDAPGWRPAKAHLWDQGNLPIPLGWTRGGTFLIAQSDTDMLQFDARAGTLVHRWRHISPLGLQSDRGSSRRSRLKIAGGTYGAQGSVLDAAGGRLAFIDGTWGSVRAIDPTTVPPTELPLACPQDTCGESPAGLAFSPDGGTLMVQNLSNDQMTLWRVALPSGQRTPVTLNPMAIQQAALAAITPAMRPEICAWDPRACLAEAARVRTYDCSSMRERRPCVEQRPWYRAACAAGQGDACDWLAEAGRVHQDRPTLRLGLADRCRRADEAAATAAVRAASRESGRRSQPAPTRPAACVEVARQPLADEERVSFRSECVAASGLCVPAAQAAEQAGDAALALELLQAGCAALLRSHCLEAGRIAHAAGRPDQAQRFYQQACRLHDDASCANGAREASRGAGDSSARIDTMALPASGESHAPTLCADLAPARLTGERVFQDGRFVGIRVETIAGHAPGRWPFEPGDVLLNSVRCGAESCTADRFFGELQRLCSVAPGSLMHDLKLQVRSSTPARNRDLLLRKAGP